MLLAHDERVYSTRSSPASESWVSHPGRRRNLRPVSYCAGGFVSSPLVDLSKLPLPPYPPTRNRGSHFCIDWERMHQSSTWILCPPELRGHLVLLWLAAWASYPMGSLPNDDAVIAASIGMMPAHFRNHRELLMRGFRLCSDNRLYHAVVDEQVFVYLKYKERKAKNKREYNQRLAAKVAGSSPESAGE
jgi:hypothetical protein